MTPDEFDGTLPAWQSPYRAWADFLARPRGRAVGDDVRLFPAIVRLQPAGKYPSIGAARGWLAGRVAEGAIRMDPDERALLVARAEDDLPGDDAEAGETYPLYLPEATLERELAESDGAIEILDLGSPILAPQALPAFAAPPREAEGPGATGGPIVGVIDDGVGFLNLRFRRRGDPRRTRFHAVWFQAFRTVTVPPFGSFYVQNGQVLWWSEIDALIAQGIEDWRAYQRIERALIEPGAHRSLEYAYSHGTHVADVAAGADPMAGDPVSDWPLLGVQLPPEAVDDTAGTYLEPMIVQGVRWILFRAERMHPESPVVINISFATFAGPKNGTKPIEHRVAEALRRWEQRTGRCARAVYAFGNARRNRQEARIAPCPDGALAFDWRLMPNGFAPSYLELRPDDPADMARLSSAVSVAGLPEVALGPIPPFAWRDVLDGQGRVAARFYHVPPLPTAPGVMRPPYYLLAAAPTEPQPGLPVAPAGRWALAFGATDGGPIPMRVEVQRGDTPRGYRLDGRQSYLDHPDAHAWDHETKDYRGLGAGCPISRQATHSSFVTARSRRTLCVAGSVGAGLAPARYSAEGAPWTRPEPSLAALSDDGYGAVGILAAGTFSGGTQVLSGTSAAAPQITRALAAHYAANGAVPADALPADDAEIAALIAAWGSPAPPGAGPRQGAGTVWRIGGGRPR